MKPFIFTLLALLGLISCSEEETFCFKCEVAEGGQTSEFTMCDITEEQAADIERSGTVVDPESWHPFGVILTKYTTCTRAD